jgi:phytoene dehydrogenase-like protein
MDAPEYDSVIVGAGPNGLAAAITIARQNLSVLVIEAANSVGGGMRSAELTLPGFTHDICSTVYPFNESPFFRSMPLEKFGFEWVYPPAALAHPFDDGSALIMENSIEATSKYLDSDSAAYSKIMRPLVERWRDIALQILGPLRFPRHPISVARFGYYAIHSAMSFSARYFRGRQAPALFAGLAAHSMLDPRKSPSIAHALVLGALAHADGWPLARNGSGEIAGSLAKILISYGGKIETGRTVRSMKDIPPARAILFDLTPRQITQIAGNALPRRYSRQLDNYRYGPGAFKVDWALDGPIPFKSDECGRAAVVHIGGSSGEIFASEIAVAEGKHPERPFVLLAQPALFDITRAPTGKQTAWAYCHVPNGSTFNMTERIEDQIERFAPGFRDRILHRLAMNTTDYQSYNSNYIGGDINGGIQDWGQLFARPAVSLTPYRIPAKGLYICSSSTPPGGGVHGMCGFWAAKTALNDIFGIKIKM